MLLLLALLVFAASPAWAGLLDGKPAPPFSLRDQVGRACSLNDYEGRPLLLKIGTTWCPSCAGQSDQLLVALPKLQELGVGVLEVFVEDTAAAVTEYRKKHRLPEEIRTCIDQDGQVLGQYSVVSIPRVLLLDKEHRVVKDQFLIPARSIEKAFEKIVAGQ